MTVGRGSRPLPAAAPPYLPRQIEANGRFFEDHQDRYDGVREKWLCGLMWQVFYEDFGFHYLSDKNEGLDHAQPWQKFVHGLLTGREGTCCTLSAFALATPAPD